MHGVMNQWIILLINGYRNGWMNGSRERVNGQMNGYMDE